MTLKIICSRNIAKNIFHFTKFSANIFLFGVRKNICRNGAVLFLDAQEMQQFLEHIEGKCLYISVYLRKKIFVPMK